MAQFNKFSVVPWPSWHAHILVGQWHTPAQIIGSVRVKCFNERKEMISSIFMQPKVNYKEKILVFEQVKLGDYGIIQK